MRRARSQRAPARHFLVFIFLTLVISCLHLASIIWRSGEAVARLPLLTPSGALLRTNKEKAGRTLTDHEATQAQDRCDCGNKRVPSPSACPSSPQPPPATASALMLEGKDGANQKQQPAGALHGPLEAPLALDPAGVAIGLARALREELSAVDNSDVSFIVTKLALAALRQLTASIPSDGAATNGGSGSIHASFDEDVNKDILRVVFEGLLSQDAVQSHHTEYKLPLVLRHQVLHRQLQPEEVVASLEATETGEAPPLAPPSPAVPSQHALLLPDGRRVDGRFTHQTCYLGGDESEICEYHGTICFDGEGPVVVTPTAPRLAPLPPPSDALPDGALGELADTNADCTDYRFYEPSTYHYSKCVYSGDGLGQREWPYAGRRRASPPADHPLELGGRSWGPAMRAGMRFKEVHPSAVFPDWEGGWGSVPDGDDVTPASRLPGLQLSHSLPRADFTPYALWMLPTPAGARNNPFMWMTSVLGLYAAQRANVSTSALSTGAANGLLLPSGQTRSFGSHPNDGYVHHPVRGPSMGGAEPGAIRRLEPTNVTAGWVSGPQWGPFPPQQAAFFVGPGAAGDGGLRSASDVRPWMAAALNISAQPGLTSFYGDVNSVYSSRHLLCSRRAVVPSLRPRLFSTRADAWMWRQYAYAHLGLLAQGLRPHPHHPPRSILLLDRLPQHGRGIVNVDDVMATLTSSGLPVRYLRDAGSLSVEDQAAAVAGAGIIIAPHGAHLANLVFAPQHAHVIELFPPLMTSSVYRRIADVMGLTYAALHTLTSVGPEHAPASYSAAIMASEEFRRECLESNVSATDAFVVPSCNRAAKKHPLVVPPRVLRRLVADAVDAIGAFSLTNPDWKQQQLQEKGDKEGQNYNQQQQQQQQQQHTRLASGDPDLEWSDALTSLLAEHVQKAASPLLQ